MYCSVSVVIQANFQLCLAQLALRADVPPLLHCLIRFRRSDVYWGVGGGIGHVTLTPVFTL